MKYLIVVDMQNDFVGGSLGSEMAKAIVPAVVKKIKECQEKGYRVIFTRDTHGENYLQTFEGKKLPVEHCMRGTWGWQIADAINHDSEIDKSLTLTKKTFGYVSDDMSWGDILNNAEEVCIIGLCTDICVVSNALIIRAYCPNIPIVVDSACCAGTSVEAHEAALATMRSCQIDVI